jgi:polyisoprenoid-binding protein YceI
MKRAWMAGIGIATALGVSPAWAEVETYTVDPRHTFPIFEIEHLGLSTQVGRFNETRGKVTLDPAAGTGSIEIMINTASVSTGFEPLEKQLRSENFFNVAAFPTMSYTAKRLKFDGERLVGAEGDLTLLGVTRPLPLVIENFRCVVNQASKRKSCGAQVSAVVRRADFGFAPKYSPPVLGTDVRLRFPVEATLDQ